MDIQKILEIENAPEIKVESDQENQNGHCKSILKNINKSENPEENNILKELKVNFDQEENEKQKHSNNLFWKILNTKGSKEAENEPKNLLGVPENDRRRSSVFDKLRFFGQSLISTPTQHIETRHVSVSMPIEENSDDDSEGVSSFFHPIDIYNVLFRI